MTAGGYVCRIVKATTGINRYDEPCLLLYLDVDEGENKNYFGKIYEQRLKRGVDRYPCVYNQVVNKFSARYFRQLIKTIEQSNAGYFCTCKGGEDWDERELENFLIGAVFAEKEYRNKRELQKVRLVECWYKKRETRPKCF